MKRNPELSELPKHIQDQIARQTPPKANVSSQGGQRAKRGMNKLELAYSLHLDAMVKNGDIARWRFEPMKLRIGAGAYYKPDFMITRTTGEVEFHETKGFWREAARVRIKVAADVFPEFSFFAIQRKGGAWTMESF